ncbi:hypothetical protein EU537_10790 [Candidatus Thorarchaeota archaeon]|nr:MAG: hypothetical protein EU537_10790 [Candidatus Thorarchaeota archaeon]
MLQFGVFDLSLGEIMAWLADPWVIGWVLVATGIIGAAWLLENITDPIPLLGLIFDLLVKIGTFVGFFLGILDILVGYVVYVTYPGAVIVAGVLILAGFALTMRVLSKFPLALVFAVAVAAFATFTIYGFLAPLVSEPIIGGYIEQIISLKWMAVIGVVIFCVVYVIGGLIIKLIELIGKIFSSRPVLILIGLAALAVGIVVLVQPGLVGFPIT